MEFLRCCIPTCCLPQNREIGEPTAKTPLIHESHEKRETRVNRHMGEIVDKLVEHDYYPYPSEIKVIPIPSAQKEALVAAARNQMKERSDGRKMFAFGLNGFCIELTERHTSLVIHLIELVDDKFIQVDEICTIHNRNFNDIIY